MTKPTNILAVPALLAALALSATPAVAAELPTARGDTPVQVMAETADYGGGWGRGHRYRHRNRTSAGDVLGAVLVIGTIAAVANAATKARRDRDYPYPDRYRHYPDRRGDYRPDYRSGGPRGVEGAAELCLREIERDARVEDVAEVERNASGWLVTGAMANGDGFACSIGADGRIERIEIGGRASLPRDYDARSEEDDDRYRGSGESGARIEAEDVPLRDYPAADADAESASQPEYPGGPLPGEATDEEAPDTDPIGRY